MTYIILSLKLGLLGIKIRGDCLKLLFLLLSLFNFFEAILTFLEIKSNQIVEANPLMNYLWEIPPTLFIILKLGLLFFLVYLAVYVNSKNIHL
ncbi:DUF5658 family protein [Niallia sp. JL1B1071]|uniref:DUF5658 family protein n=1 Tax=Niallia tiangongensis TaxID=3237105 RepID=UPI0037DCD946